MPSSSATDATPDARGARPRGPRRGFALIAVLLIAVLVALGAIAVVWSTAEAGYTSQLDRSSGDAYGVALAGVTWAEANLVDSAGRAACTAAAQGTTAAAAGINVHPFNGDDEFAGVGAAPPGTGVSNSDWVAFGRGHFGITAATEPLSSQGFVLRVIGRVGDAQEVLEANVAGNALRSLPAGLTGCFSGPVQVTFYDQESPYDYFGNMRFDGNGGVPLAMSSDNDRINGLARFVGNTTSPPTDVAPIDPTGGYPTGRRWRATQSLRGEAVATGVANGLGGLPAGALHDDNVGPQAGWSGNPYMANDPRIVDNIAENGLGMEQGGYADGVEDDTQRGQPIIAYIGTPGSSGTSAADPTNAVGFLRAEENWAPEDKDDRARKGFYACDNHSGENANLDNPVDVCTTGTTGTKSTTSYPTTSAPDWTKNGLNHSGRAWGFVSMIIRQCTGSGDSIDPVTGAPWFNALTNPNGIQCNPAFRWLENAAACLILPPEMQSDTARGTNAHRPSGDGVPNDFQGCHPGCLIASDQDNDGIAEHPYRSVCINLDAQRFHTYGPDIKKVRDDVNNGSPPPYVGAAGSYALPATTTRANTSPSSRARGPRCRRAARPGAFRRATSRSGRPTPR